MVTVCSRIDSISDECIFGVTRSLSFLRTIWKQTELFVASSPRLFRDIFHLKNLYAALLMLHVRDACHTQ